MIGLESYTTSGRARTPARPGLQDLTSSEDERPTKQITSKSATRHLRDNVFKKGRDNIL